MTSVLTLFRKKAVATSLLGVVAAGAMFGSGVLVARATMDDGKSAGQPAVEQGAANTTRSLVAPAPNAASGSSAGYEGKGGSSLRRCPAWRPTVTTRRAAAAETR